MDRGFLRSLALVSLLASAAACATSTDARPEAFPRSGGYRASPLPPALLPTSLPESLPAPSPGLLDTVLLQRGIRYQLGGASPSAGFDCSGLVQYVFFQHGIGLPRTAAEQYQTGIGVRPDEIALGDLLFFSTTGPGPTHVGIVTSATTFVHAPDTGAVVRQERFDTPYWSSRFLGARRQADIASTH